MLSWRFPFIVLVIAIVAMLGPGLQNMYIAVSMIGWIVYARLVRAEVLILRDAEYIQAARILGLFAVADRAAPRSAQCHHARAGVRGFGCDAVHPARDDAELSRPGRAAADAGMGRDDRRRARLSDAGVVGVGVSRSGDFAGRASASACLATASPICCAWGSDERTSRRQ